MISGLAWKNARQALEQKPFLYTYMHTVYSQLHNGTR
jgi:hypothetical protein